MKVKEMIEVMQHFVNGGEVECREHNYKTWEKCRCPLWDWASFDYRIKEQKQKVTIEKWLIKDVIGSFSVVETADIDNFSFEKIKLLETYEVEI